MNRLDLDRDHLTLHEDWDGTHVAFTCPLCNKVFIVNALVRDGTRACPNCGHYRGRQVVDRSDAV